MIDLAPYGRMIEACGMSFESLDYDYVMTLMDGIKGHAWFVLVPQDSKQDECIRSWQEKGNQCRTKGQEQKVKSIVIVVCHADT